MTHYTLILSAEQLLAIETALSYLASAERAAGQPNTADRHEELSSYVSQAREIPNEPDEIDDDDFSEWETDDDYDDFEPDYDYIHAQYDD